MSQDEVTNLFEKRNIALLTHELDQVFGPGNPISAKFKQGGSIESTIVIRGLIRQVWLIKKRIERIEGKMGIKHNDKDLIG